MTAAPDNWRDAVTISVPQAAAVLSISRNLAYTSAHEGKIPTIRLGGRILVPVAALRRLLGELDGAA